MRKVNLPVLQHKTKQNIYSLFFLIYTKKKTIQVGTDASFLYSIVNYRLETMPCSVSNRGDIFQVFHGAVLLLLSLLLGVLPPLLDHYLVALTIQIVVVTLALATYSAQAVFTLDTLK